MLSPLRDRDGELARLEDAWTEAARGRPQLVVLWGRRRVGKTFLLSHFLQGKRGFLFGATQQSERIELERLFESMTRELGREIADGSGGGFASWEAALRFLARQAAEQPMLVALDEAPYLLEGTPALPSIVQTVWDHLRPGTKLLLVLSGSAMGVVEGWMAPGAPLRGRPALRLRLDPMDFWAGRTFLPRLAPVRFLEAYAACGGYPLHLLAWDERATTIENLRRLAASPGGILLEDAAGILREELPSAGGYSRVLAAIGRGLTRFSQIASAADQRIERPLEVLVESGLVEKALPLGAPKGARPDYEIPDPYIRFWFRVLFADRGLIEGGQGAAVIERVRPRFETHIGWVFEELARAHARRLVARGELPADLVIGRWWTASGPQCEVDVLGLRGSRTSLLGEARWQRAPVGVRELQALIRKTERVPEPVEEPIYAFWTRSGGTKALEGAEARVFDLETMFSSG
jgi:AAA+ ATPase superfamily predicted ATPase